MLGYDITVAPSGSTSDRNTFIGNNITAPAGDDNLIIGNGVTLPAGTNRTVVIADGAGNHKIYADDTGQVGIGTSTPTSKLHSTRSDSYSYTYKCNYSYHIKRHA